MCSASTQCRGGWQLETWGAFKVHCTVDYYDVCTFEVITIDTVMDLFVIKAFFLENYCSLIVILSIDWGS